MTRKSLAVHFLVVYIPEMKDHIYQRGVRFEFSFSCWSAQGTLWIIHVLTWLSLSDVHHLSQHFHPSRSLASCHAVSSVVNFHRHLSHLLCTEAVAVWILMRLFRVPALPKRKHPVLGCQVSVSNSPEHCSGPMMHFKSPTGQRSSKEPLKTAGCPWCCFSLASVDAGLLELPALI